MIRLAFFGNRFGFVVDRFGFVVNRFGFVVNRCFGGVGLGASPAVRAWSGPEVLKRVARARLWPPGAGPGRRFYSAWRERVSGRRGLVRAGGSKARGASASLGGGASSGPEVLKRVARARLWPPGAGPGRRF